MLGVLNAIGAGIGIYKSLFGKKPKQAPGAPSPYMGNDELERYMMLRKVLARSRGNPYMGYLMGGGPGLFNGDNADRVRQSPLFGGMNDY